MKSINILLLTLLSLTIQAQITYVKTLPCMPYNTINNNDIVGMTNDSIFIFDQDYNVVHKFLKYHSKYEKSSYIYYYNISKFYFNDDDLFEYFIQITDTNMQSYALVVNEKNEIIINFDHYAKRPYTVSVDYQKNNIIIYSNDIIKLYKTEFSLGIEDRNEIQQTNIYQINSYPNPSTSGINFQYIGNGNMTIVDNFGKIIYSGAYKPYLKTDNLRKGTYHTTITTPNATYTNTFIIQ